MLPLAEFELLPEPGCYRYRGAIPSTESGAYGFSVRVVPTHPLLTQEHELRLIAWAA